MGWKKSYVGREYHGLLCFMCGLKIIVIYKLVKCQNSKSGYSKYWCFGYIMNVIFSIRDSMFLIQRFAFWFMVLKVWCRGLKNVVGQEELHLPKFIGVGHKNIRQWCRLDPYCPSMLHQAYKKECPKGIHTQWALDAIIDGLQVYMVL